MDLNADLGEGCPWDRLLLDVVTSASICCGFHAGDPATIARTLDDARARGVVVGAHPGYPDREGFGRRDRITNRDEVDAMIREQVEALAKMAQDHGVSLRFLKPHGAMYNQATRDAEIAIGVVAAAKALGLAILGQPGGEVALAADREQVRFVGEGFADRGYDTRGRLLPRDQPGALLEDQEQIAAQVVRLATQGVQTLCIHGDQPRSVEMALRARDTLRDHNIVIGSVC